MKRSKNTLLTAALVCGTAVFAALPSQAKTVYLSVEAFTKTLPDGTTTGKSVLMWGYREYTAADFASPTGNASSPGPAIVVPPGDSTLVIHLKNNLDPALGLDLAASSIVIPGQNGYVRTAGTDAEVVKINYPTYPKTVAEDPRLRTRSWVKEAWPGGAPVIYQWDNVTPGTYLYHSGSRPQLQVQMGLYGALTKTVDDSTTTDVIEVYPPKTVGGAAVTANAEVVLLLSEIDTKVHDAVAAGQYGRGLPMSSTIHSVPDYFLINGDAYPDATTALSVTAGQTVLVRLLNAGNNERVPVFNGQYLSLIAEDGRLYPWPREQYAPLLPALKTTDALWSAPAAAGEVVVYDRRLGLANGMQPNGGMIKKLTVN